MEDINYLMKPSSFQREGHSLITLKITEAHQETTRVQIRGMQALNTPWSLWATLPSSHCYKTPHQIAPRLGHTVFDGTSPLRPPLPGKAINVFFYTSLETLSPRFDSALGHRGRVFRISNNSGASLVAQWLRIRLPMQGTRVRALVWEDPTCRGATGPVNHNYWAWASGACAPQQERLR